jgi:formyltetrahydrofolate-dependent phosphoribosylglycinamide formyltransferase
MPALPRLAILASGAGSNFAALVDGCRRGDVPAQPALLLCNQPRATVLDLAAARNIPARCIDHRAFADRSAFDHALIAELRDQHIDFVALAGFMRILTADFVREYCGSLLNIHPSLLPKYPGLHTHRRALEAGDAMAGATVHYVTPALDAGPAIPAPLRRAVYKTATSGLSIKLQRSLSVDDNGDCRLTSEGSCWSPGSARSVFRLDVDRMSPQSYVYQLSGPVSRRREVHFDEETDVIRSLYKKTWYELPKAPGTLDRMSQQEQLRLLLLNDPTPREDIRLSRRRRAQGQGLPCSATSKTRDRHADGLGRDAAL